MLSGRQPRAPLRLLLPAPPNPRSPPVAANPLLWQVGRDFCAKPWGVVEAERANEIHVDRYCFRAPFVEALLAQGLGVAQERVQIGALGALGVLRRCGCCARWAGCARWACWAC